MIRELDFSKITIRIIEHEDKKGEGEDDHIIAKLTGNTLDTLRRCLVSREYSPPVSSVDTPQYTPTQLTLRDNHGRENKITVSLKYLPVQMKLDPSESFNNQGTLRVDVLDAADLPAADRNGYSDPYCKFHLNGKEVYKTKTQKKTLHPAWNEFFEVPVRSRTAANFEVNVYDWDFGDKADFLGKAAIDLTVLEPFQKQEVTLGLDGKSGAIRLQMLFKPDYVVRSRQGSSTFSGTFAVPGKVIGAPVKGVGKGAVLIGGGVARGATFLGRGFRRRKSRGEKPDESERGDTPPFAGSPEDTPVISIEGGEADHNATDGSAGESYGHNRGKSWGAASFASAFAAGGFGAGEPGTAHMTVVAANGFPPGTNVRVHVKIDSAKGPKEVHKTKHIKSPSGSVVFEHESFKVPCTADSAFRVIVKDHATFGSDDELGEAQFFVDDQGLGGEKSIPVGPGVVIVRSSFEPREGGALKEPKSPSRKGLLSRGRDRDSRSVTPA
jgi:Ca2+-dependent lipid-binding protein